MLRSACTENGVVVGVVCADPRVTVFKGVPYAAPPVGPLRWRAPQPALDYPGGIFHADHFGHVAYQKLPASDPNDFYSQEMYPCIDHCVMGEDCLTLNIWTPAHEPSQQLPVYFWIHGGGLQGGYPYETAFDGESLARQGIVVITVGYRLGPFGFLCHETLTEEGSPGCNFGFLDLVAALQWIRRNISAFGGNPQQVTIGGQSGGAQCVTVLMTAACTEGLFHGAITQSGGGLRAFGYGPSYLTLQEGRKRGRAFMRELGVESLEDARKLPAQSIMEAHERYTRVYGRMEPVLDGSFLAEDPTDTMLRNAHHHIPVLLGSTTGEGPGYPAAPPLPTSVNEFRENVQSIFGRCAADFLRECGAQTMDEIKVLMQSEVFNLRAIPSRAFAEAQARQGRTTYLYVFDAAIPGTPVAPAYHGSDMWFTFDNLPHCRRPFTGAHYDLARAVSGYWANFIRSGNVNGKDHNGEALPAWKAFTSSEPFVMRFTDIAHGCSETADPLTRWRIDHHFREYREHGTVMPEK